MCDDIEALIELADELGDQESCDEAVRMLSELEAKVSELSIETLMQGDYDDADVILSLHAGAGGTEAQDWTQMLYRMYTRYAERKGFKVKLLDFLDGDEAGIKSVSFEVSGENAYGYLRRSVGCIALFASAPLIQTPAVIPPFHRWTPRFWKMKGTSPSTWKKSGDGHLPLIGRRRPAREHDGFRRAHDAYAYGHRGFLPE